MEGEQQQSEEIVVCSQLGCESALPRDGCVLGMAAERPEQHT